MKIQITKIQSMSKYLLAAIYILIWQYSKIDNKLLLCLMFLVELKAESNYCGFNTDFKRCVN